MCEIKLILRDKEVKGFIIEEINKYYKIGTYLGIVYRKREEIDKLNNIGND